MDRIERIRCKSSGTVCTFVIEQLVPTVHDALDGVAYAQRLLTSLQAERLISTWVRMEV